MRETKIFITVTVLAVGLWFVLSPAADSGKVGGAYLESASVPQLPIAEDRQILLPQRVDGAEDPEFLAKSVLVKDINSDLILFQENPQEQLFIASLTKMLTALTVLDEGFAPEETILVEPEDVQVVPVRAELAAGREYRVSDLLSAMLVGSANDAARALARSFGPGIDQFVAKMNTKARGLGMANSSFANPVGFDDPTNFSTAEDLTLLVDEVLRSEQLRGIVAMKSVDIGTADGKLLHHLESTNKLLDEDARVQGIKTGFTNESLGSLTVFVSDSEHPYYLIVLGSTDRESDALGLIDWAERSFVWR